FSNILVAVCLTIVICLSIFNSQGITGIIPLIKPHYDINDSQTAIIQTSSSITHAVALVLVWLFGDMFRRRTMFLTATAIWIVLSLLAVFFGSNSFMTFVILRALAGGASAVFATLVSPILADLFKDRALGIALMFSTFSETVAMFVSMIVSSWIVTSGLSWQSALIVYPLLAIAPLLCILCVDNLHTNEEHSERSLRRSFTGALGILSIKSVLFLTAANAFGNFYYTGYTFWFPTMYLIAWTHIPSLFYGLSFPTINTINTVAMLTGMACGLPIIVPLAQSWRFGTGRFAGRKEYNRAYPIIVSTGSTLSAVMFIASILLLDQSYVACLIVTFFVGFAQVADATLTQQMRLMVVPSNYRASATALNSLIIVLVSTPSAQLVGMLADVFRGDSALPYEQFHAYQLASLCFTSTAVASAICFVFVVYYFPGDCKQAEQNEEDNERTSLLEKHMLHSESVTSLSKIGHALVSKVKSDELTQ
ncbi:hypothetical protein PENTCL1PPCAC_921, partial [Pristionchus entomophagus]